MEKSLASLDTQTTSSVTSDKEVTVPGKRISMRKTREVLRLHFELQLGQRQVARSVNVSQSTVHEYLERFQAAGLSWPLPPAMSEAELERALFPADRSSSVPANRTAQNPCPISLTSMTSCSATSTPL